MTIEDAIKLNEESDKSLRSHKFGAHADAVKLGIEALKEIKHLHQIGILWDNELLPGEE